MRSGVGDDSRPLNNDAADDVNLGLRVTLPRSLASVGKCYSEGYMRKEISGDVLTPVEILGLPGRVRTCTFEATAPNADALIQPISPRRLLNSDRRLIWLYLFAFWSQFKPSEPFLVDYLVDHKGLPQHEVYQDVFPLFIYARLPCVFLVGIASACWWGGTRKVLIAGAIGGLTTTLLTRFGQGLVCQQIAQFTVAASFASHVCCPAVFFAIAESEDCQRGVHTLKAIILLSNCFSSSIGEILRDYAHTPLNVLFDISAVSQAISLVMAVMLPWRLEEDEVPQPLSNSPVGSQEVRRSFFLFVAELRSSLFLPIVVWWTMWTLWMTPVHGLVMTYWQGLVRSKHILSNHNGTLLACMYLAASVFTFVSGKFRLRTRELIISSMVLSGGMLMKVAGESRQEIIYAFLLLYQCVFEVVTAIATFQVGTEVFRTHGFGSPLLGGFCFGTCRNKTSTKLTLLWSATSLVNTANENLILFTVNSFLGTVSAKFFALGVLLCVCSAVLLVAHVLRGGRESSLSQPPSAAQVA